MGAVFIARQPAHRRYQHELERKISDDEQMYRIFTEYECDGAFHAPGALRARDCDLGCAAQPAVSRLRGRMLGPQIAGLVLPAAIAAAAGEPTVTQAAGRPAAAWCTPSPSRTRVADRPGPDGLKTARRY